MLGSNPACKLGGGHVGEPCPSPPSAPAQLKMKGKLSRLGHLGNIPFLLNRERMESLCSEWTPLSSGTHVSTIDTGIHLAVKKIEWDTNSVHSCQSFLEWGRVGIDDVCPKVWPRSFLLFLLLLRLPFLWWRGKLVPRHASA